MVAMSFTVHGITRIPAACAASTISTVVYDAAARTGSPPKSSMSMPPSHGEAPGRPTWSSAGSTNATMPAGARFRVPA
jgi:hypothetical protein